jgi:hypothetical protein
MECLIIFILKRTSGHCTIAARLRLLRRQKVYPSKVVRNPAGPQLSVCVARFAVECGTFAISGYFIKKAISLEPSNSPQRTQRFLKPAS